ncbi:hypothetical protein GT3570_17525 (plasmid) [Geobacillus thermoleovorans]|nr:hypothetical protein GT3570_17525 [Geobacillus thermoleovorans]
MMWLNSYMKIITHGQDDFHRKDPWAARFALHPGMKIMRQSCIFTEKIHGQRALPSTRHENDSSGRMHFHGKN